MLCGFGRASAHGRTRGQALLRSFRAEQRNAVPTVLCPPRPRHTHLRVTTIGARGSVSSSLPFFRRARILTRRAPRATLSRVSIRARYAHVRHFSFFAFTSSPLCRKSLSDSRFGVKDFSKVLHRGEASDPHPPSDCNRPPNDRSTRTHPEGENHEKPPAKCRKTGATAPRSPTAVVKAWVKGFPVKPSPLTV